MSESVLVALIGVAGAVIVVVVSVVTQFFITKKVIKGERDRVDLQIQSEEAVRRRERRSELFRIALSELVAVSDPDNSKGVDHGRAANLICQVEMLLDRSIEDERTLDVAMIALGESVKELAAIQGRSPRDRHPAAKAVFVAQGKVIELSRAVLANITGGKQP